MCWSFNGSLVTWIISFVVAVYLLVRRNKNDVVMGGLILIYSSMQLWESLMWYDQKCGAINMLGTKLAYISLWAHIIAISIGLYIEYNAITPIFLGVGMLMIGYIFKPDVWKCSKPGVSGHLIWGFNPMFYPIVFTTGIIMCLYYIRPRKTAILISSLFISTMALSYLYNNKDFDSTGSFWCWICAIFSFVFVFVNAKNKLI